MDGVRLRFIYGGCLRLSRGGRSRAPSRYLAPSRSIATSWVGSIHGDAAMLTTMWVTAVATTLLLVAASSSVQIGPAPRSPTPPSIAAPVRPVTFADGLDHPWGLAFLPD